MWNLPVTVIIDEYEYKIRKECDYRVVLDVINALNDEELNVEYRFYCALYIFYEEMPKKEHIEESIKQMMKIINLGKEIVPNNKPTLMDWEHDFSLIAPPVNRVLGYSVRNENNYTHWYDFVGAYMEIGDCSFSHIVSIRNKRLKGEKLDKSELEFYKDNRDVIDLPRNLSKEEREYLELG